MTQFIETLVGIFQSSGFAKFGDGQQENSTLQCANGGVAVAGGVLDFGSADDTTDVRIKQVFVGAVEPGVNGACSVGVHI